MLKKFFALGLSAVVAAFSLACSLSDDETTTATTTVTGTITDSSLSSKSAKTGDTLTATATELDTGETFTVTVSGRTYSSTLRPGLNVNIEVKSGDTVILSRVLDKETLTGSTLTAEINSITTIQGEMIVALKAQGKSVLDARKEANVQIFGTETVLEANLGITAGLALIEKISPEFAAQVATYAHLVGTATNLSAIKSLRGGFRATSRTAAQSGYRNVINNASATLIDIFASAQNGANASGRVGAAGFQTLTTNIGNSAFNASLIKSSTLRPSFGTAGSVLKAAPGVVFTHTFPAATTKDALKTITYSGSFSSTIGGLSNLSSRTLKFIPAQSDVGTTFTYTLTATGGNGKTTSTSISIAVTSVTITGVSKMLLSGSSDSSNAGYYRPTLGPVLSGDYFYLVARFSSNGTNYRLEKYPVSSIDKPSSSDITRVGNGWVLPSAATPTSLLVKSNIAYLTNSNTSVGLIGYDTTKSSSSQDYSATSMTGTEVAILGSSVYSLNTTLNSVQKASLTLGSVSTDTALSSKASSFTATTIDSIGDYLYLANSYTASFYSGSGFLANDFTSSSSFEIFNDSSLIANGPVYTVASMTTTQLTLGTSSYTTKTLSQNLSIQEALVNGTYAFVAPATTSGTIRGYSLVGSSNSATSASEASTIIVNYTNASNLDPMIINKPEGIDTGKSGAYLYTAGQYTGTGTAAAAMTGTWYIKAHKIQPAN